MEVKPGYKQTEVGVIPEEWDVRELRTLTRSHNSGIYKRQALYGHGCNIVGVSDIYDIDMVDGQSFAYVPLSAQERAKHTLHCNDLLYGESSLVREGIARTVYVTERGAGTAFAWHTRRYSIEQRMLLSSYLYYYLQSRPARAHMVNQSIQTAITGINTVAYFACPITVPSFAEQKAIAEALSDADALIESLEQLLAKKRQLKQGAMQELLTGRKRLPGFESKPGHKLTEVGVIPEDWEVQHLGNVAVITTGWKDVNEGNPAGEYPFFTCSRSHTFSDHYSFDMEAILIAGNGDVGNLHYYSGRFEAYQRTYVVHKFSRPVRYLWHQLDYRLIESLGFGKIGTSIPYIKRENLTGFAFPVPATESEQRAIAAILSDMDAELAALEATLSRARQLKQGMMQELLTGRIRLV